MSVSEAPRASARIWIGPNFASGGRVLVLGESWYGEWPDADGSPLVYDDEYVAAYLAGGVKDPMYTRIANATGLGKVAFWQRVAFTNFVVERIGALREHRPTVAHYASSRDRLRALLEELAPRAVWVLGKEQSAYSAPVIKASGVRCVVSRHPTSYGVPNSELGAAWAELLSVTA
jgi:hypothetical protein